jgi:acyl-CoA synthetase (AMP-forming)/AMP-acid ligase II
MDMPADPARETLEQPNVTTALSWQARRQPNGSAVHYPRAGAFRGGDYASCTFQELDELSESYSRGLTACGIGPGVRSALLLTPDLDFIAVLHALFKVGAVPVLIDPAVGMTAMERCLAESSPRAVVAATRSHFARKLLGRVKDHCELLLTAGSTWGRGAVSLRKLRQMGDLATEPVLHKARPEDAAAVLFTSGSTGEPKGVVYRHRHFNAQVDMLRRTYGIQSGEVCLSAIPPLALFDPALGMTTVVPELDPTRPAEADAERLVRAIDRFGVTNVFGSPAMLDQLSQHCVDQGVRLESVTRVVSAGAPLPLRVVRQMQRSVYRDARVFSVYGATECLPISNIEAAQIDDKLVDRIESGDGLCIGRPVEPTEVRVIRISDMPYRDLSEVTPMPFGMPGEIIVAGPVCTDQYCTPDQDTGMHKISDAGGRMWHRTGDVGLIDGAGRLWFWGRVAQRIDTGQETLFPEQCEAIFNQHPDLVRSALVGIGPRGRQIPVLCIQLRGRLYPVDTERVHFDLLQLAQAHAITRSIRTVLFHPGMPVDGGRGSSIRRKELADWAAEKING